MISDPSTLLLLKCGILCHKDSEKLHLWNISDVKLVHAERARARMCVCVLGVGGGLHMLVLFELLGFMFNFCCFNVESSVY